MRPSAACRKSSKRTPEPTWFARSPSPSDEFRPAPRLCPTCCAWARVVARFLRPGGTFCIVEIHPNWSFIDEVDGQLQIADSVFRADPWGTEAAQTYADGAALPLHQEFNWPWTVAGLVTALINAGLRIERLRELPVDVRQRLPSMVRSDDGYWHLPGDPMPLMVTCVATRPM